jgi:hypothetical protein
VLRVRFKVLPAGPVVVEPPEHLPPAQVVVPDFEAVLPLGPVTVLFEVQVPPAHWAVASFDTVLPAGPVVEVERVTWALAPAVMASNRPVATARDAVRIVVAVMVCFLRLLVYRSRFDQGSGRTAGADPPAPQGRDRLLLQRQKEELRERFRVLPAGPV